MDTENKKNPFRIELPNGLTTHMSHAMLDAFQRNCAMFNQPNAQIGWDFGMESSEISRELGHPDNGHPCSPCAPEGGIAFIYRDGRRRTPLFAGFAVQNTEQAFNAMRGIPVLRAVNPGILITVLLGKGIDMADFNHLLIRDPVIGPGGRMIAREPNKVHLHGISIIQQPAFADPEKLASALSDGIHAAISRAISDR